MINVPDNLDVYNRKEYLNWQKSVRRELVSDTELEDLVNSDLSLLGKKFVNSPTLNGLAKLVFAYMHKNNTYPTSTAISEYVGSKARFYASLKKVLDFHQKPRFIGEITGMAIESVGASNSNILRVMEDYQQLQPGRTSIQRGVWIPKIDKNIGWLTGILTDSVYLGSSRPNLIMSCRSKQRPLIEKYITPLFEDMFNYTPPPYLDEGNENKKLPFSVKKNTMMTIGDKTIVSFFLDIMELGSDKKTRKLPFDKEDYNASIYTEEIKKSVIGGIIDWNSTPIIFDKDDLPYEVLSFSESYPIFLKSLSNYLNKSIRKGRFIRLSCGTKLVEQFDGYGVRFPQLTEPTLLWAAEKYAGAIV